MNGARVPPYLPGGDVSLTAEEAATVRAALGDAARYQIQLFAWCPSCTASRSCAHHAAGRAAFDAYRVLAARLGGAPGP